MKETTKTFSIDIKTYEKFENICKDKGLNKSEIIQKNITQFIIDNFDIEDKHFVMKHDDEYKTITIIRKENEMLYLSDGNIMNYMTFDKIYEETSPVVNETKRYIDKLNDYQNIKLSDIKLNNVGATDEEFNDMIKAGVKLKEDFNKPFMSPDNIKKIFNNVGATDEEFNDVVKASEKLKKASEKLKEDFNKETKKKQPQRKTSTIKRIDQKTATEINIALKNCKNSENTIVTNLFNIPELLFVYKKYTLFCFKENKTTNYNTTHIKEYLTQFPDIMNTKVYEETDLQYSNIFNIYDTLREINLDSVLKTSENFPDFNEEKTEEKTN